MQPGGQPRTTHPGSGFQRGEAMGVRGRGTLERYLVGRTNVYHRWVSHPVGQCTCRHQIWVAAEEWEARGFVLAGLVMPRPRHYMWYFWHYEVFCEPESACGTTGWVHDGDRLQAYRSPRHMPHTAREILSFVADVAQIAGMADWTELAGTIPGF